MTEQTVETGQVYCGACEERGVETRMRWDADFGGHLCPVCEPLDVKMIGRREDRVERYERLYGPVGADVASRPGPTTTPPPEASDQETQ